MRLNEYKNISDDVMDVSKKIYQEIFILKNGIVVIYMVAVMMWLVI